MNLQIIHSLPPHSSFKDVANREGEFFLTQFSVCVENANKKSIILKLEHWS